MKRKRQIASDETPGQEPRAAAEVGETPRGGEGPVRACGAEVDLDAAYALMARHRDREQRALEWSEALIGDVGPLRP